VNGYDPGPVDGSLGSKTQAALRLYQAAHDLNVTGYLDRFTLETLGVLK
jgi:peptidoglycan hydrolase-like protein with peptidoglycan-binding domain